MLIAIDIYSAGMIVLVDERADDALCDQIADKRRIIMQRGETVDLGFDQYIEFRPAVRIGKRAFNLETARLGIEQQC